MIFISSCIQYDKDTILKAIYNTKMKTKELAAGCIQYDKDTILKAIYNSCSEYYIGSFAVFSMTKIQF